jgi:hypothetical protein
MERLRQQEANAIRKVAGAQQKLDGFVQRLRDHEGAEHWKLLEQDIERANMERLKAREDISTCPRSRVWA